MDADERALFGDAVTAALAHHDADRFVAAVRDDGWAELCADDAAAANGVLFERAGAAAADAPVLDLAVDSVAPDEAGARPVVRLDGREDPAACDGRVLHVEAAVLGGTIGGDLLVGFPELGNPAGRVAVVAADQLQVTALSGLDPAVQLCRIHGDVDLSAVRLVDGLTHDALVAHLRRCTAHLLVGLAEHVADLARDYVTTRQQFGRALGSWQTVAHRLAETHVDIAAARATLDSAWRDGTALSAAVAKGQAGATAHAAIDRTQQLFGAIGFTWEHQIHRYVRRCLVLDAVLGSEAELATEIGTRLLTDRTLEPAHVDF